MIIMLRVAVKNRPVIEERCAGQGGARGVARSYQDNCNSTTPPLGRFELELRGGVEDLELS